MVQIDRTNLTQADIDADPGLALLINMVDGNDQHGVQNQYNYFFEVSATTAAYPPNSRTLSEVPVAGTLQATLTYRSLPESGQAEYGHGAVGTLNISGQVALNPDYKFHTDNNIEIPSSTMVFMELYSVWYQTIGRAREANFREPYHESTMQAIKVANSTYRGDNYEVNVTIDRHPTPK